MSTVSIALIMYHELTVLGPLEEHAMEGGRQVLVVAPSNLSWIWSKPFSFVFFFFFYW